MAPSYPDRFTGQDGVFGRESFEFCVEEDTDPVGNRTSILLSSSS